MSDIRGLTGDRDALGRPRSNALAVPVLVDKDGRVVTSPSAFAQSPDGLVRPRANSDGTQLVTAGLTQVRVAVPGIGYASAYTSGDAFGTSFVFDTPIQGTIATVIFHDYDDEGLTKEIVLFNAPFMATANDSPFTVNDDDMGNCVGVISVATFYNFALNQIGISTPALYYIAPLGRLYGQLVTRGADNIAQGARPLITIVVV